MNARDQERTATLNQPVRGRFDVKMRKRERMFTTTRRVSAVVLLSLVFAAFPGGCSGESVRRPVVAGAFYPADPSELRAMVGRLTDAADRKGFTPPPNAELKAVVMPHAGYIYSGASAAHVSHLLEKGKFDRVIVMGPDHRVGFRNGVITDASWFETPLGKLRVDADAAKLRKESDFFRAIPKSDQLEHSVEVLVPFLQVYLGEFTILPVVAGPGNADDYISALSPLLDDRTLLAISSDLSHYLPYSAAVSRDRETIDSILALDDTLLRRDQDRACGLYPLRILIGIAREKGWKPFLLNYCNSGDTAGDKKRVVGYATMAFFEVENDSEAGEVSSGAEAGAGTAATTATVHAPSAATAPSGGAGAGTAVPAAAATATIAAAPPAPAPLAAAATASLFSEEQGGALVSLARATITAWFNPRKELKISAEETALLDDAVFDARRGVFVTLTLDGRLRGCIGSLTGAEPIKDGVRSNALKAAFHDPRFPPLKVSELDRIHVEVSILTEPAPLRYEGPEDLVSMLRPGEDGVILRKGRASATFLPQVWKQLPSHDDFLSRLCVKAGLSSDAWRKEKLDVLVYQVRYFEE